MKLDLASQCYFYHHNHEATSRNNSTTFMYIWDAVYMATSAFSYNLFYLQSQMNYYKSDNQKQFVYITHLERAKASSKSPALSD